MTAWASFYPLVLPYVSGAPDPLVDSMLRLAAREFCEGGAWLDQAAAIQGDGATQLFSFTFPAGAELVRVARCTVDGEDVGKILDSSLTPADWLATSPDATALDDSMVVLNLNTQFLLYPVPADAVDIVVYQALRPTMTGTGVGDVIFRESGEAVAHGAIARLCGMRGKPWANMDQAVDSRGAFEAGRHLASNRVFRQGQKRTKQSPL